MLLLEHVVVVRLVCWVYAGGPLHDAHAFLGMLAI